VKTVGITGFLPVPHAELLTTVLTTVGKKRYGSIEKHRNKSSDFSSILSIL
jgi:hypothetical protein